MAMVNIKRWSFCINPYHNCINPWYRRLYDACANFTTRFIIIGICGFIIYWMLINWPNELKALGPIVIAAVAVSQDKIKYRIFPPRLRIRLRNTNGIYVKNDKFKGWFYHLSVYNKDRKSIAHETQLNIVSIYDMNTGDNMPIHDDNILLSIRNTSSANDKTKYNNARDIGPEVTFDFIMVYPHCEGYSPSKPVLQLYSCLEYSIPICDRQYRPIDWCISLKATSVERDSRIWRIRVKWDGEFSDKQEEMKKHIQFYY